MSNRRSLKKKKKKSSRRSFRKKFDVNKKSYGTIFLFLSFNFSFPYIFQVKD